MTPRRSSLSSPPLTGSFQCRGTIGGLWAATGAALGSTKSLSGGLPFIKGRGLLSQVLKADDAYRSKMYFLRMWRLSSVGGHGRVGLSVGGGVRSGHEHGLSPGSTTPVLVQGV